MSVFVDAALSGQRGVSGILSSYDDAVKTYEMTWAIRWASERTRRPERLPIAVESNVQKAPNGVGH